MHARVKKILANNDYTLKVIFTNDEEKIVDISQFLDKGAFKELKNINIFKSARIVDGSVMWNNNVDLSPETLYFLGK